MANLGDQVKCRISGFEGIVTGRAEFLYGCKRLMVTPKAVHDGKPVEAQWFDEDQMKVVKAGALPSPETAIARAGGPMSPPPPRHSDPRR